MNRQNTEGKGIETPYTQISKTVSRPRKGGSVSLSQGNLKFETDSEPVKSEEYCPSTGCPFL